MACDRSSNGSTAQLTLRIPDSKHLLQKANSATSLLPSNRKACFAVNVTGPGITMGEDNVCSFTSGIVSGFAESNSTIQLTVPKGANRKVEVFLYLSENTEDACPKASAALVASQIRNVFLVGTANGVDTMNDQTQVEITVQFPGTNNHLAQTLGLPSSCSAASDNLARRRFSVSAANYKASNGPIELQATIGRNFSPVTSSSGSIRLIVK